MTGLVSLSAMADGGMPLQDAVLYTVPDNLESLSTEQITDMRAAHQLDLEKNGC